MPVNLLRPPPSSSDPRLYLTEEALDQSVELLLAATRRFWSRAETALAPHGLGPAHYRALAAIRRRPGLTVTQLRETLGVRKQSLARVINDLLKAELIAREIGDRDRRERFLRLTEKGAAAEALASSALRERLAEAFRAAGADAVAGARLLFDQLALDAGDTPE